MLVFCVGITVPLCGVVDVAFVAAAAAAAAAAVASAAAAVVGAAVAAVAAVVAAVAAASAGAAAASAAAAVVAAATSASCFFVHVVCLVASAVMLLAGRIVAVVADVAVIAAAAAWGLHLHKVVAVEILFIVGGIDLNCFVHFRMLGIVHVANKTKVTRSREIHTQLFTFIPSSCVSGGYGRRGAKFSTNDRLAEIFCADMGLVGALLAQISSGVLFACHSFQHAFFPLCFHFFRKKWNDV